MIKMKIWVIITLLLLISIPQNHIDIQNSEPIIDETNSINQIADTKNEDLKHLTASISTEYIDHKPIRILNDSAFGPSGYNFPGVGTVNDPYIIDGYNITASSNPLIQIENTTKYFEISNNLLKVSNGMHGGTFYKGSEYKLITTTTGWISAKAACEALGGHLVTISDIEESDFVTELAKNEDYFWIGLTDNEDYGGQEDTGNTGLAPYWVWITGESLSYTNWLFPNPNDYNPGQDWVLMSGGTAGAYGGYPDSIAGWNDFGDADTSYYMCEWDFTSIHFSNVSNGEIRNNIITNASVGIQLEKSENLYISENEITHLGTYAILANQSDFNNFSENVIQDVPHGILLNNSNHNIISENNISNNEVGVSLLLSTFNNVSENLISDSSLGISLQSSSNTRIFRNTLIACLKAGIDLQSSSENVISWNNFFLGHRVVIFNGHKYIYFYDKPNYWYESKAACELLGGHLLTIKDQEELDFVVDLLYEHNPIAGGAIWIGLTDKNTEGSFEWITEEAVTFTDWYTNQPNGGDAGDYAVMWTGWSPGTWNDLDYAGTQMSTLGVRYPYICEWDSIDYIVDVGLGNNSYLYNYWDGFDGPDENSDGIADIPHRLNNHGLSFDGTNDYADFTDFAISENFTLEFWLNPLLLKGGEAPCIIGKHANDGTNLFRLWRAPGNDLRLELLGEWNSLGEITTGWQHLALTAHKESATQTNFTLYKNGNFFSSIILTGVITDLSGLAWVIGQDWDTGGPVASDFLKCVFDDIRFVNQSLTASEIYDDYTSPNNNYPVREETVAWYLLNETSNTSIHDSSGNGNHGTAYSGAGWKHAVDPFPRITPIWIDSNDDFTYFCRSGRGTIDAPYIIDNQHFVSIYTPLIEIKNTDAYFEIKNSSFDALNGSNALIYMVHVENGKIVNNTISYTANYGIYAQNISYNTFSENEIHDCGSGILLTGSSNNNLVSENRIYNILTTHGSGIKVDYGSNNNNVSENILSGTNNDDPSQSLPRYYLHTEDLTDNYLYWVRPDIVNRSGGVTLESRARLTTSKSGDNGPLGFYIRDGTHYFIVSIGEDFVLVEYNTLQHFIWDDNGNFDSNLWHTYRITAKNGDLSVYVDGNSIGGPWQTTRFANSGNYIFFGVLWSATYQGIIDWDYVYIAQDEATAPPTTPEWDLLLDMDDIPTNEGWTPAIGQGNTVSLQTNNKAHGITIGQSASQNSFSDNTIFDCLYNGFYLTTFAHHNTFSENKIYECGSNAFTAILNTHNSTFNNNYIWNTTSGISLTDSCDDILSGNVIFNTSNQGIKLDNVTNGQILNNNMTDTNIGIKIDLAEKMLVVNNQISTLHAISAHQSNFTTFSSNTISDCVTGVGLDLSNNNTLFSNTFSNCMSYGILVLNSENNTINYNTIEDCYNTSIYLNASSNNEIIWNTFLNNGYRAYDSTPNNLFCYNYYDDHTGSDISPADGFIDTPYLIDGGSNEDLFPRAKILFLEIVSPLEQTYGPSSINILFSGYAANYWYNIEGIDSQNQSWTSSISYPLPAGVYFLHVYGNDSLGILTFYSFVNFTVETTPPLINLFSPLNATYFQDSILLEYSITDYDTYTIYLDGTEIPAPSGIKIGFPGVADEGRHNITIEALDHVGNIARATSIFYIYIPPSLTIESPVATTYETGSISINLAGDALHYWYYIENVDTNNQTWTSEVSRNLPTGVYTLHAYGNSSTGAIAHKTVTFTIDIFTSTTTTLPTTTTEQSSTTTAKSGNFPSIFTVLLSLLPLVIIVRKRKNEYNS